MNNSDILVSVIVPVYKVEKYLPRCIESIQNQTYKNLEIILVDDGSPDNSGAICDEYAKRDNRIKVIHQDNKGLSGARNAGLNCASGGYICFVDSDDYLDKDLVKENLQRLLAEDADVIIFNIIEVHRNSTKKRFLVDGKEHDTLWNFSKAPVSACCKLYKADIWKNLRFPVGLNHEDYYTMPYVVTRARKIITNEKYYYYYDRTNEGSITTNSALKSRYVYFLIELPKLEVSKGKFAYLRQYAMNTAFKNAFRAYHGDLWLRFLTEEQRKRIEDFFDEYKNESNLLNTENRIYLWGYQHCKLINRLRGIEYYFKWRNPESHR